jgi:hypothetical protein
MGRVEQTRRWLYRQLEPSAWPTLGLSPLNKLVGVAICVAALVAILESESTIHEGREAAFFVAEVLFTVIFVAEYSARLWTIGEDPAYAGFSGRLRYALTPAAIIDLLAVLPMFVVFLGSEAFILRIFRLIRILRLARLGRFSSAAMAVSMAVRARRYELLMSLAVAGGLLLGRRGRPARQLRQHSADHVVVDRNVDHRWLWRRLPSDCRRTLFRRDHGHYWHRTDRNADGNTGCGFLRCDPVAEGNKTRGGGRQAPRRPGLYDECREMAWSLLRSLDDRLIEYV